MGATALLCTSHSPLMSYVDPDPGIREAVETEIENGRRFIRDFAPDRVVMFAPDHYNGVFYDMMPPFAIGSAAISIGDYDSPPGDLLVDRAAARHINERVLASDIDVTLSERMYVDHGFAQPIQLLLGGLAEVPVVPIFINSLAVPLGPPRRARALGSAVGAAVNELDGRTLFIGSGGLSHSPPAPTLADADPATAARLISEGRNLTPQQRAEREMRTVQAAEAIIAGTSTLQPLNPAWDRLVMDALSRADFDQVDAWTTEWFTAEGGIASHETRNWIAAHAALAAGGDYEVTSSFYQDIPAWIVGFGLVHATLRSTKETPS